MPNKPMTRKELKQYGEELAQKINADMVNNPPHYTAPPQREWQGLTDEEVMTLVKTWHGSITLASAIEAKLKAKNAT